MQMLVCFILLSLKFYDDYTTDNDNTDAVVITILPLFS